MLSAFPHYHYLVHKVDSFILSGDWRLLSPKWTGSTCGLTLNYEVHMVDEFILSGDLRLWIPQGGRVHSKWWSKIMKSMKWTGPS